jgi:RNA polymerase sigma-70 factor (ECF subfamily)
VIDDPELVERAREGDDEAFGDLVDRHQGAAYRACLAVLGSPTEAEDAAQEAFVLAHRHLGRFRGASSFKTWLLTIAWRHALDRRRSLRARFRRFVAGQEASLEHWASSLPSPEAEAMNAQFARDVERLVQGLPLRLRAPLLLAAGGDHTYEEMAEILGKPVGTVKWRVSEARRLLRERMAHLGHGDE